MTKTKIIDALMENNATETNNGYVMTESGFNNLLWEMYNDKTVKIVNGETKNTHVLKSGKTVLNITVKKSKNISKTEKNKTNKTPSGGHGVKSKNTGYIIELKNIGEKPKTLNNITTCADIKLWIKTLNRKNIEYLRIYDTMRNVCRKSAWIERTNVVNG